MNILMVLDNRFPPDIRVEKEARSLIKTGHHVYLLCRPYDNAPVHEEIEGINIIRVNYPRGLINRALNYIRFLNNFIHPFWESAISNVIKKYQIDALHIHDLPLVKTAIKVAGKYNIPVVADLHENYPEAIKIYRRNARGKLLNIISPVRKWKDLEKYCVRRADKVITVVEEAKQHYIDECGIKDNKIVVIMNYEDLEHFLTIPVDDKIINKYQSFFTITYVGAFGYHRGIDTAIMAMPAISTQIPHSRLLIVGSGSNQKDLIDLAKKLHREDVVEFTGWQPFNLVPSYIAASQICLVPYQSSDQTNASAPHKLFQYMAMSKPVIVSSMDSLSRIIKETGAGLVFTAGNAKELADLVIGLYENINQQLQFGQAGFKAVQTRYNWNNNSELLKKLYANLVINKA
jgi:glycosyltransferase involved in cell wall biosynthesis